MNSAIRTFLALALLAGLGACAAPATQQPTPTAAQTRANFRAAFADLIVEETRDERAKDGCRSNGESTADDAEDCEITSNGDNN